MVDCPIKVLRGAASGADIAHKAGSVLPGGVAA